MYIFSRQLIWSVPPYSSGVIKRLHLWWPNTTVCGGILLPTVASMQWVWNDKVGLDTAAVESSFATCPSKEDKARVCNETEEPWRMAGSLQCGPPPLGTHSWTWHEGDWPWAITSWEGMPRYSCSTASLGRQWEPFGDTGLRSWITEPKKKALSCQLLVAQKAPLPLTEGGWWGSNWNI